METTILNPEEAIDFLKKQEESRKMSTTLSTTAPLIQVGQKIMSDGIEYEVKFYNDKNNTFTLTPLDPKTKIRISIGQKIILNQRYYKIVYINFGQRRINVIVIQ